MKKLLFAACFCLVVCAAARPQAHEISVVGAYRRINPTPLGSISEEGNKDDDTKLKGGSAYGARLTLNTKGYYGHEVGYLYGRAKLTTTLRTTEGDTTVTTVAEDRVILRQAFYNFLIYFMPRGERWRPFITGGAQAHQYGAPDIPEWPTGSSRNYGFNYGGGIKLRLFEHALVRLDVRDYIGGLPYNLKFEDEMKFGGRLRQREASFGLSIGF